MYKPIPYSTFKTKNKLKTTVVQPFIFQKEIKTDNVSCKGRTKQIAENLSISNVENITVQQSIHQIMYRLVRYMKMEV